MINHKNEIEALGHKIADKDRIGIYGGSYGGYATLAGVTFTPELYYQGNFDTRIMIIIPRLILH